MSSRGNLIVISAPSGAGKTSLAAGVLKLVSRLEFSVSHTTRNARAGERHGVEYVFVSEEEFRESVRKQAFLEYARVHGHYYGTSREFVESMLEAGNDVLLDIDVQGARKVKEESPDSLMVFVFPPSLDALRQRLKRRGLDDNRIIEQRLRVAKEEITYYREYGYVIINEEMEKSVHELKSIILAARCGLKRQSHRAEHIIEKFLEE